MNPRFNVCHLLPLCAAGMLVIPSCHHADPSRVTYTGTIEKIEDLPGSYYFPETGKVPVTKVRLRSATDGMLTILVPGIYSEAQYGAVGDVVTFSRPFIIPFDGVVSIGSLESYAVAGRKKG